MDNLPSPHSHTDVAIEIVPDSEPGGEEALVTGIAQAEDGVRVALTYADGRRLEAHIGAARAEQLELRSGAIVRVRQGSAGAG